MENFNTLKTFQTSSEAINQLFKSMIFLEQYADCVVSYTSKYNNTNSISYAPDNIIGKPVKYPNYGDFPDTYMLRSYGKWWNNSEGAQKFYMTQDIESIVSEDFIVLSFEYPVIPTKIIIYETYNPGAVVKLWGRNHDSKWLLLWEGAPECALPKSRPFSPTLKQMKILIHEVRIDFNQSILNYHTALDAVLLAGYKAKSVLQNNLLLNGILPHCESFELKKKQPIYEIKREVDFNELDTLSSMPCEVLVHIFQYLDLRSLCRCSQVNKKFYSVMQSSILYKDLSFKRYWNKITNDILLQLAPKCRSLRKLDLSWCGPSNLITWDIFKLFLDCCGRQLTHLSLGKCDFVNNQVIDEISKCTELTDLRLRVCDIPDGWKFSSLYNLNKLVSLDLYSSTINDESLIKILTLNKHLRHLILDLCEHLENLDVVVETLALYNPALTTFSAWKTHSLTSNGVKAFKHCHNLRELDLGWCLIRGDPGNCLEHIAQGCSDLRRLIICGWRGVSDHLLLPILRSCKNLSQLDLLGIKNITSDICERILASLAKLELLEISFCDTIKPEQVSLWREQYPNVVIQRSCEYVVREYWN